jgi:hypothetical protein
MYSSTRVVALAGLFVAVGLLGPTAGAQTSGEREEFTAIAIANDDLGSGATNLVIQINRWSTDAERGKFLDVLRKDGPKEALGEMNRARSVGTIRTPGSLGYDLRYAQQTKGEDGGRQILLMTDRPLGFWETWNHSRSTDYPFTVIQMEMKRDGRGQGTLSDYAKLLSLGKFVEVENLSTSPIKLTQIIARKR